MNRQSKKSFGRPGSRRLAPAATEASARQKYEQYLALARAADGNGDRVAAQNYYQHAEHYLRASREAADERSVDAVAALSGRRS